MTAAMKGYKGIGMEGPIANWYAKNTAKDAQRFEKAARAVIRQTAGGSKILEVAPGPGYLAILLAKSGRKVTALDISRSFVQLVRENAVKAGVEVDVELGNASAMPLADSTFDFVVCMAAFKNFTDPVGALNEIYRVLKPGGRASIIDLRKEAQPQEIDAAVKEMRLSAWNAFMTRFTFRHLLLKRAYAEAELRKMAAASRFGRCEIDAQGIGFEWKFEKRSI